MAKANRSAASQLDPSDQVDISITHLVAMLETASAGAAGFHELSVEVQENFFWACKDKALEVEQNWLRMRLGEDAPARRSRKAPAVTPANASAPQSEIGGCSNG